MTIKIHKWKCDNCDDSLFLRVNDEIEIDRIRLTKFESHVSRHCIEMEHEFTHTEKEDRGFRIV
jgi:hypothetical protein